MGIGKGTKGTKGTHTSSFLPAVIANSGRLCSFETPQETKVWAELAAGAGQNGQRFYFAHGLLCEVKRFAKP